jgi:hypothetical protein
MRPSIQGLIKIVKADGVARAVETTPEHDFAHLREDDKELINKWLIAKAGLDGLREYIGNTYDVWN